MRHFFRTIKKLFVILNNIENTIWDAEKHSIQAIKQDNRTALKKHEYSLLYTITNTKGISEESYLDNKQIIVSLTSYGYRINEVYLVIESLLHQTLKPNRIVLWLDEEEFDAKNIPLTLKKQISRGLEVLFCEDIKSYKKLIPSLKKFPNDIIITVDDDVLYPNDIIERLYSSYCIHPDEIICCNAHIISYDDKGQIKPYIEWDNPKSESSSLALFPIGACGILYPPNIFHKDILNYSIFKKLAPNADDVWFKTMSLLNNVKCRCLDIREGAYNYVTLMIRQNDISLSAANCATDNDIQIKQVFEKYNITNKTFKSIPQSSERILPEASTETIEDYILFLKHQYAYNIVGKKIHKGKDIIEIGCGDGYGAAYLAELGIKVVALDINAEVVEHAKERYNRPNLSFYLYDGNDFPFHNKLFDVVISFQVIEHVQDISKYLRNIKSLLKPGGLYYITTPNRNYRLASGQSPWNKFHFREFEAKELLKAANNVFTDSSVWGITAKDEVRAIEVERVRSNRSDYDGQRIVLFKPNTFIKKYNISDFYICSDNIENSLDLLLTNDPNPANV